jgi:pyruvate dehydrogenase E2 component (dihydrolipoamide acetyltransferase)
MANTVIMPKIGITVEECILTTWHKKVGDHVSKGDILFSYETDKTAIDQESEFEGTLLATFYEEGDVVPCLKDVCVIGEPGEKVESAPAAEEAAPAPAEKKEEPAPAPAPAVAEKAPTVQELNPDVDIVIMPKIGITVEECILTTWNKKVGDKVSKGDILFSYETDKTAIDQESEFEGELLDIFYEEGDVVPCLEPVCAIGKPGTKFVRPEAGAVAQEAPAAESVKAAPVEAKSTGKASNDTPVSPRAKTFAKRLGIDDFSNIVPTGPEGRIIAKDVENYAATAPKKAEPAKVVAAPAEVKPAVAAPAAPEADYVDEPLNSVRKYIKKSMTASLQDIPQLTLNTSFDATVIMALRAKFKANEEFAGITLNDMLVHAVAKVILDFPMLNAHLNDGVLRKFKKAHIGVAVDTARGLMVPTLVGASDLSLLNVSKQLKELIAQTKEGKLPPDNPRKAAFTISNLGSFGIESFTPVINPPQTGILGVDTITYRIRKDGTTYPAMGLSLTLDHGAMDGADGARFLKALVNYLENFDMMQMK